MTEDTSPRRTKGWFTTFWHDYTSFGRNMNWRNFTFVHLSFEYNPSMGYHELELALLGLGFRLTYVYDDQTETRKYLDKLISELDNDGADSGRPFNFNCEDHG